VDRPSEALHRTEEDGVSLKRAATLLGVHYMTAYRYVRQGRLAAEQRGSEWVLQRAAIEAFRDSSKAEAPHRAQESPSTEWANRLESCLLAADEVAGWQVIESALAAGHSPTYCYTEMIAAALSEIGVRWAAHEIDVADQHVATAVAMRLIGRLGGRFRRRGRSRGTFVFGAPRGEFHSVPIAILADLVRLGGYDVLELGADVPPEAFVSSAERVPRLVAIGIGVSQAARIDAVRSTVDAVRAVDPEVPIVVGGLAAGEIARQGVVGVTAFAADGAGALGILGSFAARRAIRRVI
jgi:excisionase family DNA binding protein